VRRTRESEIDVPGRAGTREAKLENEPTFEKHRICKLRHEASEEAVENKQLTLARELGARLRR
jgi:hypothetical protein